MATTRTFLINASTRHAIFVGRYAGSQLKFAEKYLEQVKNVTLSRLSQQTLTEMSKKKLEATLAEIDSELEKIYSIMGKKLASSMKQFATYEADFSAKMFTKATNADFATPAKSTVEAAVFSKPLFTNDDSVDIESSLRQFSKAKRAEMAKTIKTGVIAGRTNDEIIKDIQFVTDKIQRNHAAALVQTITNFVSMEARQVTIDDNSDLVTGVEWVSTLDGQTTAECAALDGQVFGEGEGPRPPIHWGCRSTVIPVVNPKYSFKDLVSSERPSVGADGAETADGRTNYNSWLRSQPDSFQDEVLGPAKGALFRDGGLNVSQFVDKNYQPLTLDELKEKEPAAFEKAGLNK